MSEILARNPGLPGSLSAELAQLLEDAEERVLAQEREEIVLSPEEEIEAVLPADVLEALDEPLDEDPSDVVQLSIGPPRKDSSNPSDVGGLRPVTGLEGTDNGGSEAGHVTTGARIVATREDDTRRRAMREPESLTAMLNRTRPDSTMDPTPAPVRVTAAPSSVPPKTEALPLAEPRQKSALPSIVLGDGGAAATLAEAVAARKSTCLAFETAGGTRRIVLADGDFVAAASTFEHESLSAFLVEQGEIPRFSLGRLVGKVPAFGRHAGAALVAHGYLAQDRLWPVLRSHAEWLVSRCIVLETTTLTEEADPPTRLKNEHSVFAATTGAEVFVDVVRRVIAPSLALSILGGETAHLAEGRRPALLAECGLDAVEERVVVASRGGTVHEVVVAAGSDEILPVVYALRLLGVVEALPAIGRTEISEDPSVHEGPRATDGELEAEAVEARVRARLALVEEGDYFAVLGVARDATGYEIRRSFLELRRSFEPSRLLSRETVHLAADVKHIVLVLEEAYDVLRDASRRERYRRAIEIVPGS